MRDQVKVAEFLDGTRGFDTLSREERSEVIYELRRRKVDPRDVADSYRIGEIRYRELLARIPGSRVRHTGFQMPVPPTATDIPCEGKGDLMTAEHPRTETLAICEPCQVKKWCIESVRPKENHFTGIAGGVIWINGNARTGGEVL